MNDEASDDRQVHFDFDVSRRRVGAYANTVSVWNSTYELALDWALTEPPEPVDDDDPASPIRIPGSIVARVRFGEIRRPFEEDEPDNFADEA